MRKSEWKFLDSFLHQLSCPQQQAAAPSVWGGFMGLCSGSNPGRHTLVSIALVFASFLTLTGFMKGTDGALASSFHALWQSHCVSQCELLFLPLCPSDVLLSACKGRGFILSVHIIISLLADSKGCLCISSYNLTQYPSQMVQILFCFINMFLTTARAQ